MDDPRVPQIRALVEPVLAESSAELVELIMRRHGNQTLVRLLVDKVGGVTIQDCTRLNRAVGQALEEANLIDERYTLEVSSPGLDRPLISKRDFERAIGEDLDLELTDAAPGKKQLEGMLLSVQEQAVVITTSSGNVTVPFDQIRTARKSIRF